ncbi:hypothetical protein CCACVL1_11844 [Corchorus capsularis]|uniref:Uncharacterized protein n=1 Tax=Corchorus capsularis TaxID=210143 RepID=A0A1R3IJ67_COCAP|nr:hypothetical protein CCACVL1_11844 [Corchorus capsularis]
MAEGNAKKRNGPDVYIKPWITMNAMMYVGDQSAPWWQPTV